MSEDLRITYIASTKLTEMKVFLVIFAVLFFSLVSADIAKAQADAQKSFARDTTPIEYLDYHLSKPQFMYYYGTDDTARAIINMFYRKRGIGVLDFFVYPVAASVIGDATVLVGALMGISSNASAASAVIVGGAVISVIGLYAEPIYYLIQRSNYSRQKLIYVLVSRERGMGIPYNILNNLRDIDFQ